MAESPANDEKLPTGLMARWHGTPLYLRILIACIVGALLGAGLREWDRALRVKLDDDTLQLVVGLIEFGDIEEAQKVFSAKVKEQLGYLRLVHPISLATALAVPSRLLLRLLGALAAPLVLVAVVQALMQAQIPKGSGVKLVSLLLFNTTVAILIGLAVANVLQPGKRTSLGAGEKPAAGQELKTDPLQQLMDNVPRSL